MASFFEKLARKLGMKEPPPPREIPNLLTEGQFGPLEGQPTASLNVPTFDVLAYGLDEPNLKAAKERLVGNTRKIIGEAKRASMYAKSLERPLLAIETAAFSAIPTPFPPAPDPVPRQVILDQLAELERKEEQHKRTYYLTVSAQQKAAAESARAIAAAGGEVAYAEQQRAKARAAESAAAQRAEWTALAQAGDPAGKAWLEWKKAEAAWKHAHAQHSSMVTYAKTPEAQAAQMRYRAEVYQPAYELMKAWEKKFYELKRQRDLWIAQQGGP